MIRIVRSKDSRIPDKALLLTLNDHEIEDFLEYRFYNDIIKRRKVLIQDNGTKKEVVFQPYENIDIQLEEPVYRQCENDCDFCFINGLPKGLRKELYFRDDDYRLSFLFGNFLSLTNICSDDIKRIGRLKLSPLYVSVHTTDLELRCKIFKNEKAKFIMQYLSSLVENDIKLHCQIVVIPGVTDGKSLIKTISDLSELHPGVSSIGLVPVGRTKYISSIPLVSKKLAQEIIDSIEKISLQLRKKYKKGFAYCADELYIKADKPIPPTKSYDDFPQHENGIGMVRLFVNEIKRLTKIKNIKGKYLILTGRLALPFLHLLVTRLNDLGCINNNIDVASVDNLFLGKSVTVSGLISAQDFERTIQKVQKKYDRIILPPNCTNDLDQFIDNRQIDSKKIIIAAKTINQLMKCLQ